MKAHILFFALAAGACAQPVQLVDAVIKRENLSTYQQGQPLECGIKSEDGYVYVRVYHVTAHDKPKYRGYNLLEILVSDQLLPHWPRTAQDVQGKSLDYFGDYDFTDGKLEACVTERGGRREEHFLLLREYNPNAVKMPAEGIYEKKYAAYLDLITRLLTEFPKEVRR